jgi:transcriptional regulator with XRE-family HTH domain
MFRVGDLSNDIAKAFSAKLVAARLRAKLTQEELGFLSGLSRAHVSRLEKGEVDVRLSSFMRVAGGLGLEPADLLPSERWHPPAIPSAGRFTAE